MTSSDALRGLAILLLLASGIVWLLWFFRSPARLYAMPILLWVASAGSFLLIRAYKAPFTSEFLNNWSLAIYIQAGITLLGIGLYAWLKRIEPRVGA